MHSLSSSPMASLFLLSPAGSRPVGWPIRASASNPKPKSDPRRPWWAPLFPTVIGEKEPKDPFLSYQSDPLEETVKVGKRPAKLTEEKARVLRRETRAVETWRDAMYNSAIASRLAFPDDLHV